jgi:GTP-binding protein
MANSQNQDKVAQEHIRNIAIIAHVDHGKTTLVDAFLKQSNVFRSNQEEMQQEAILDSGELEREKGITIKAKNVSIRYKDYKINIIDTPGHSDFGGEVERTLNMADGCLLIVDAQEGPMPQTKFVLKKALELKLKPIVVINKIDKRFANAPKVVDKLQDLFLHLATDPDQLEFTVFYAIGRDGKVFKEMPTTDLATTPGDMIPLLDGIIDIIPPPVGDEEKPFQMQITSLDFDPHQGRYLVGKVRRGTLKTNDSIVLLHGPEGGAKIENGRAKRIMVREGMGFVDVDSVSAGEIAAIIGIDSTAIGGTVCVASHPEALPMINISPPAVKMLFEANTSPFMGKEGKFVTAKLLQQRLEREIETNISLKITKADGGGYYVAGRGELQLSILIETMRREGYEFQVRKPEVVLKEVDGKVMQPIEELIVDVPEEYQPSVTSALIERKAELANIETENGYTRITSKILTAKLFGLRSVLVNLTKGQVVMNSFLLDYVPFHKDEEIFRRGVLIASEAGTAMGYSLNTIQERGELLIFPGTAVYEGMIIGINKYEQDLEVNPCKERAKSGVRMKHDEITQTSLKSITPVTLEFALVFLAKDEILEVTPENLRLRKAQLTKNERVWAARTNLSEFAKQQMGVK